MNSPLVFCKEDKRLAYYGDALREDHFSERLIRVSVPFWSKMHKWPTSRALLPLIVKFGVATAEEVGIETLADRLILQKSIQSVMVAPPSGILSLFR